MTNGKKLKVYLDWNVLNAIEKRDEQHSAIAHQLEWLEKHILQREIVVPYSNAHLNDLYRGFVKNKAFIDGHLYTLERLTGQLCLTQYWGEKEAKWHYRPPTEFFEQWVEECELLSPDFIGLF